jgi:16S rRNA (cytosine967-C5)-methyltransferase
MKFLRSDSIYTFYFIIDLADTDEKQLNRLPQFDAIIADVPCSGSGTWGRTPEWLSFFNKEQLTNYTGKQRAIISSAVKKLKTGKPLVYITCSVYADENENNVDDFTQNLPLQLERMQYFQFSKKGGDTLFGARLIKK